MVPSIFDVPVLTQQRLRFAYVTAIATDALQFLLGPLGWAGADEVLDLVAAILIWRLLGFHPLLLPHLRHRILPVADMLPTSDGMRGAGGGDAEKTASGLATAASARSVHRCVT